MFTVKTIKGKKYLYMQTHEISEMLAPHTPAKYKQKERCLGNINNKLTWQLAKHFFDMLAYENLKWEFHCLVPTKFRCVETNYRLQGCPLKGSDYEKFMRQYMKRKMNRKNKRYIYDDWLHRSEFEIKNLNCGICNQPLTKLRSRYKNKWVHDECLQKQLS